MRAAKVSRDAWAKPVVRLLFLLVAGSVAAAQDEPRVGTWELNLAKSTLGQGKTGLRRANPNLRWSNDSRPFTLL